ncbi:TAXI family TRAP transporter solute-binding subunit [Citreicella sp. C3M06]|uniref:TAXI family TRAP transporter solute-binding subunit n=1 Tax=Citreicella sp. C3M06 TaxID=2841564 RepID=UPI001C09ED80|nr:TAXI family TRAP transporter solute-binding subunit [Citreicella sp. C3M06]MBU2961644.1 TAXI family TRAP transporter solute-binding subunit [Citreicella sp. C3M06]
MSRTFKRLIAPVLAAGTLAASPLSAENLEWTSGSPGGSWFSIVTGLSNIIMEHNPDIAIRVVPGGGRDNPTKIEGGISQMGMGIDFLAAAAMKGMDPYDQPQEKLTSMGGTWAPAEFHVIVDAEETRSLEEILSDPESRIGTSPRATSEELTLQRSLAFYDNSADAIADGGGTVITGTYSQLTAAFQDDQIDVLFGAGSVPTGIALEVETGRRDAKLLAFPEALMDYLNTEYGYGKGSIAAGSYESLQSEESGAVPVTTLEAVILVSTEVPEDTVYAMTKTLLENQEGFGNIYQVLGGFDAERAWQNQPVPLNPGAERAYRELGYMD